MNDELEEMIVRASRKDIIEAMKKDRAFAEAVFDLYEEWFLGIHHDWQ
jgi:hypothetical protein